MIQFTDKPSGVDANSDNSTLVMMRADKVKQREASAERAREVEESRDRSVALAKIIREQHQLFRIIPHTLYAPRYPNENVHSTGYRWALDMGKKDNPDFIAYGMQGYVIKDFIIDDADEESDDGYSENQLGLFLAGHSSTAVDKEYFRTYSFHVVDHDGNPTDVKTDHEQGFAAYEGFMVLGSSISDVERPRLERAEVEAPFAGNEGIALIEAFLSNHGIFPGVPAEELLESKLPWYPHKLRAIKKMAAFLDKYGEIFGAVPSAPTQGSITEAAE